jgi:iron complex outermembrane receptor protein
MRIASLFAGVALAAIAPAALAATGAQPAAPSAEGAPVAAVATAGAAAAADAAPTTTVDEVVVTARKRDERLKDVPVAVTPITAQTLEKEQVNTVMGAASLAPGVNINTDAVGRAFISIRGIGTTLIDTVQPGVGIFVDDIYQPDTSYLLSPLMDVAQVEVLRGPQGTLFGNNTLGGAISVTTRTPTDTPHGFLTADYAGPDNYYTIAGSVSGPIIPGVLDGRIGVSDHSQDGFEKNVLAGGHAYPLDQQSVGGTLRWMAAPGATITLNAYYDRVHGGETPYIDVTGPKDYSENATLNVNSLASYIYRGVNAKGVFDVGDTKATVIASYDNRAGRAYGDGDFGPLDFIRAGGYNTLNTYSGEARFDTKWNDSVSSLIGVYGASSKTSTTTIETLVPFSLTVPSTEISTVDQAAVFGTFFFKLPGAIELATGLRFDHQTVSSSNAATSYKANELQPRITLSKHWSEDNMTYVSISRGFRGGGTNGPGAPNPIYRGDSVWTYELGEKYESSDRKLTLNADVFYNDYKNYIGQNSLAPNAITHVGFVAINLNSGTVHSAGAELEADWRPAERWEFQANLTAMHARIVDGTEYVQTTGLPLPSNRILFLPDWDAYATGSYTQPLAGDDNLRYDLSVVAKGNRVGSTLDPSSVPVLSAYSVVNANITWTHGPVAFALWSTNLLNDKYLEAYLDKSLLTVAGLGFIANNLALDGDRRRVGVRIKYAF